MEAVEDILDGKHVSDKIFRNGLKSRLAVQQEIINLYYYVYVRKPTDFRFVGFLMRSHGVLRKTAGQSYRKIKIA